MRTPSDPRGLGVFHGLDQHGIGGRDYCEGWTAGHDDALQGVGADSSIRMECSWFATGYRDGFNVACLRWEAPAPSTLMGIGLP